MPVTRFDKSAQVGVSIWKIVASTSHLSRGFLQNTKVDAVIPENMNTLVMRCYTMVASRPVKSMTVTYPKDWREAVKLRFAPAWFTKRWPVVYETHTMTVDDLWPDADIEARMGPTYRIALFDGQPRIES